MAYESVRGKIDADFTDLGEKELKNIARPVKVSAIYLRFRFLLLLLPEGRRRSG
jgi:hypothetical protein